MPEGLVPRKALSERKGNLQTTAGRGPEYRLRQGVLSLLLCTGLLLSPDASATILGLSWDNDLLVGQDKNYTNGLRLSVVGSNGADCEGHDSLTCDVARFFSPLPGVATTGQRHALTVSLEQIMITPEHIRRTTPDYSDLPYVGYSNLEFGLFNWDDDALFGFGARVGVVGPDSGAEEGQKLAHRIIGARQPEGWDNQLGQDLIGGVFATYMKRGFRHLSTGGYQTEVDYGGSVDANNFDSNVQVAGFLRFGRNLPGNFMPDYAGVGNIGSLIGLFDRPGPGWEIFMGLTGQYNAYSYVEAKSGPYDVHRRDFSGGAIAGFDVRTGGGFSFAMTFQSSSSPWRKGGSVNFGNLSFMWAI